MAVYARISIIGMDKFKELYSDTFGFYPKMSYVYIGKDTTSTDVTKSATAVGVDKTFLAHQPLCLICLSQAETIKQ